MVAAKREIMVINSVGFQGMRRAWSAWKALILSQTFQDGFDLEKQRKERKHLSLEPGLVVMGTSTKSSVVCKVRKQRWE